MSVISTKNKFGGGCSPFIIRRKIGGHSQSSLLLFKAGFASIRYELDHIVTILIAHHTSSKTAIILFNRICKIEALREGNNIHLCLWKPLNVVKAVEIAKGRYREHHLTSAHDLIPRGAKILSFTSACLGPEIPMESITVCAHFMHEAVNVARSST